MSFIIPTREIACLDMDQIELILDSFMNLVTFDVHCMTYLNLE